MARIVVCSLLACAVVVGCGSKADAPAPEEDPQFTADYVDDYENDVDEQTAQEQEQALLDQVDDLDDVEVLDDAPTDAPGYATTSYGAKNLPPKRAPHGPVTILQDDPHFKGLTGGDPDVTSQQTLAQARQVGARIIRLGINWCDTVQSKWGPCQQTVKPNFTATDPDNYDWTNYDRLIDNARAAGMQVLITLSAPMPYWGSEEPQHCLDQYNADQALPPAQRSFWSCSWKPDVRKWAQFVTAAARHFKTRRIWAWTLWNEPNIPVFLSDEPGTDDNAMRYRKMWFAGRKAIRKTAGVRARVFFGDNANGGIDPTGDRYHILRQALCLHSDGKPFTGKQFKDCPDAPRVVQASGFAFHPYSATPTEFSGSVKALESIMDEAESSKRLRAGRGVYLTEHGFLTGESENGNVLGGPLVVTPVNQAIDDDLAVHFAFTDPRIKTFAQYTLYDDGRGVWDCGLLLPDGTPKPAYPSFKVAIDVKKSGTNQVQIFTLARLASTTPVVVSVKRSATDDWHDVDGINADALGYGTKTFDATGIVAWSTHYLGDRSREVASP